MIIVVTRILCETFVLELNMNWIVCLSGIIEEKKNDKKCIDIIILLFQLAIGEP